MLQFPLGKLSDSIDRRLVMVGSAALSLPVCLLLAWYGELLARNTVLLYIGVVLLGGLLLPVYSICVAHANDYLVRDQIVAASGTLVLVYGMGTVLGPSLGAAAIERLGGQALFLLLAVLQCLAIATSLFRLWHGQERVDSGVTAVPVTTTQVGDAARLNPDAEVLPSSSPEDLGEDNR